jgi:dipeptidyl aminopeptidase/acylaminoacyl peptidase
VFWAAGGRSLLLLTDRGHDRLALARLELASGEIEYLRQDPWPAERLEVSHDGRRLALCLNRDGYSELHLEDLTTGEPLPAPALPAGVIAGLDFTADGRRLAIVLATPRAPHEIHVYDLETGELRQVTHAHMAGIPRDELVEPRLVRYPSFDGLEISALVFEPDRPPAGAGGEPRPLLVYAHGGPSGQSRPRLSTLSQYFVRRGYVVLAPNVRGSSGYGRAFLNLDNRERREDSVADLKFGVDRLIAEGGVDPERVAIHGGSYGGYMVLAALTLYPEMWAAGVSRVGIANFVSFLERTGDYRRSHREEEYGDLEEDRALLERLSPLGRVDRIRAPLMVIHGANDPRVPVGEAEQIVAALRARGGPVEYLRYEDEGHGLVRLENRIDAYSRMAGFLDRYLGAEGNGGQPAHAEPVGGDGE